MIGYELYRNIGLAMICIFVISLTMLADVKISLMVMACVILTMVGKMKMKWFSFSNMRLIPARTKCQFV